MLACGPVVFSCSGGRSVGCDKALLRHTCHQKHIVQSEGHSYRPPSYSRIKNTSAVKVFDRNEHNLQQISLDNNIFNLLIISVWVNSWWFVYVRVWVFYLFKHHNSYSEVFSATDRNYFPFMCLVEERRAVIFKSTQTFDFPRNCNRKKVSLISQLIFQTKMKSNGERMETSA